jgi:mercuric ion transport protein
MLEQPTSASPDRPAGRWALAGASLAALLAATCCVLPIALTVIGLGGSWLALLGPFVAYRVPILLVVAVAVLWSWYRIWRSRRPRRWNLAMALMATAALLLAVSAPLWENQLARQLWDYMSTPG